jgi:hypothetical protein
MKSNNQTKDPIAAIEKAMEKIVSMTGAIYARDGPRGPFDPKHHHFVLTVYYDMLFYGIKWNSIRNMYDEREVTEVFVREFIVSRGRCVLQEIDGRACKVVRDDPIRPGDIHSEKETAYV